MLATLKKMIKAVLGRLGFEVVRAGTVRTSFAQVLKQLTDTGFQPRTLIDVGVAYGTPELHAAFKDARLILVEAMEEWEPTLKRLQAERGAEYVIAAAGPVQGHIDIAVPKVLAWASTAGDRDGGATPDVLGWYSDSEGIDEVTWREVPMITLDGLRDDLGLEGPFVLKIDVEGAEAGVLEGARGLLGECEVVLCEMTIDLNYWEVHSLMHEHGFVLHDVYGQHYRPSDDALVQVDMVFVKAGGALRQGPYFLPGQQRRVESIVESLAAMNPDH